MQTISKAKTHMDLLKEHCTDSRVKGGRIVFSNRGIALLITLWLLVILSVMAFSFTSLVRTETYSTYAFKDGLENKYFAEAGIQRGIAEIFYRITAGSNKTPQGAQSGNDAVFQVDGTSYTERIGEGHYRISIADEGGKININSLSDQTGVFLNTLLTNAGMKKEEADGVVDAILDWKDNDSDARLKGAETEYYMSLPSPYKAKNKEMETLDELALVKGISPELLYGDGQRKGLIHFLTVYHKTPQLNLDVASKEVLLSVPGMTPEILDGILTARKNNNIDTIRNYQNVIANKHQFIMPYLGVGESGIFTIHAIGYKDNEKKGYPIVATVMIDGNNQYRYLYYKSPGYILQ